MVKKMTRHKEQHFSGVADGRKQVYILENLCCANCAAKIERKIRELPQVDFADIIFPAKQLHVVTNTDEELLPVFQDICNSFEDKVKVTKKKVDKKYAAAAGRMSENKKDIIEITIGIVLLIAGTLTGEKFNNISLVLYLAGYLALGHNVAYAAVKNLGKGHALDENFLMSIATIGAFIIGEYTEAVGIILFYRIGGLFEEIAVAKSRRQIMEAVDLRPEVVSKVEADTMSEIPAGEAKIGDILLVRPGERIPLDGTVIEGKSRVDTSPVTGEPVPVSVSEGSKVISGCINTSGLLKFRVDKALEDSMVTRVLNSVENAAAGKPKIDRFITKFSRVYTPIVVVLAILTAVVPSLFSGNWEYWIYTALTFLVISCPCALVLSVPLAFFSGIGAGSKKGILFKSGNAIDVLKGVKSVIMDKTGTVTKGCFEVQDVITGGKITKEELLSIAAGAELNSTHPIGNSIVSAAKALGLTLRKPKSVEEISGKGVRAGLSQGIVLCGSRRLLEEAGVSVPKDESYEYGTEVFVAFNRIYAGRIIISDSLKDEAKFAIAKLKSMGLHTAMLTGDEKSSADYVAMQTGIDEVYSKLLPEQKIEKLRDIRKNYGSAMFVGDGINDAPVLAGADVGAAMGSGTDAAIEAADVVFMTSSVEAIPEALKIAKVTGNIARQNVVFALSVKIFIVILGFVRMANMWMAVFADTGVAILCILNSVRLIYRKRRF